MQRRRFTIEFKQQVIQEAKEMGNAAHVARRHNINPKMLYRWIDQAEHIDWQTWIGYTKLDRKNKGL